MTRKEAKELLPIIQAFAEGKEIEYYDCNDDDWIKTDTPIWASKINYRIKPEQKYRPFKSQEECWNEMHKHQPFGWVEVRTTRLYTLIIAVDKTNVVIPNSIVKFDMAFEDFKFKDGTPFGIKEE